MHFIGVPFINGPVFYGPLWFVRDLLILNVLSFLLIPIVKKTPGYLLISAMVVFYFLPIDQQARYAISFFIVGMHFGLNRKLPVINNPKLASVLLVIGFCFPIIFQGNLAWKISVLIMCWVILSFSEILVGNSNIRKVAIDAIQFSFPIYLLHEYPVTTSMRLLALTGISLPLATIAFLIVPFLIIFVCIVFIAMWKRLFPKMFTFFTGGR